MLPVRLKRRHEVYYFYFNRSSSWEVAFWEGAEQEPGETSIEVDLTGVCVSIEGKKATGLMGVQILVCCGGTAAGVWVACEDILSKEGQSRSGGGGVPTEVLRCVWVGEEWMCEPVP